jgi:dihydrofolate reductase
MGLIEYSVNVSVDGFIEDADGSLEWSEPSEEIHRFWNDLTGEWAGTVMGRRLYEAMVPFWPDVADNPTGTGYVDEFAALWMSKPRLVASRTLEKIEGGCELIEGDAVERVRALRESPGETWSVGGAEFADSLMAAGVIDRIRLVVMPVLLGNGKSAFGPSSGHRELRLVESRDFGCGSRMLLYGLD